MGKHSFVAAGARSRGVAVDQACPARSLWLLVRGSASYFTPTVSAVEQWQAIVEAPKLPDEIAILLRAI